jgi:FkbM family methyltransferase
VSNASHAAAVCPLAELLDYGLAFSVLEVGARPIGPPEPYHALLELFPLSRISALEIDPALCDELNGKAPRGLRYYACALGRHEETRTLYETAHPMCSSLYEPDPRFDDAYNELDVMRLKGTSEVRTKGLDAFVRESGIGPIDFIKLDIQGAELEVLQGGPETLDHVLAIVTEAEFVPLYKGQPLFGDVDAHLRSAGFMLHKFLGLSGRVMKPLALQGSPYHPVQVMWTDAVFTRDYLGGSNLDPDALLKLAVLLDLYGSRDAVHYLLRRYDDARKTTIAPEYLEAILDTGKWQRYPQ